MNANTFDVEKVYQKMDKDIKRKAQAPSITGDYEIEPTGNTGWMAYRYQFRVGTHDYFGYAETIDEARENIIKAQQEGAE